jgi:hypothetical protein
MAAAETRKTAAANQYWASWLYLLWDRRYLAGCITSEQNPTSPHTKTRLPSSTACVDEKKITLKRTLLSF